MGIGRSFVVFKSCRKRSENVISWGHKWGKTVEQCILLRLGSNGSLKLLSCLFIGVGLALMHSPGIGIISQYFRRRQALAIGFCISGSSLAQLVVPVLVGHWLKR